MPTRVVSLKASVLDLEAQFAYQVISRRKGNLCSAPAASAIRTLPQDFSVYPRFIRLYIRDLAALVESARNKETLETSGAKLHQKL
jgi:hypothetical protein